MRKRRANDRGLINDKKRDEPTCRLRIGESRIFITRRALTYSMINMVTLKCPFCGSENVKQTNLTPTEALETLNNLSNKVLYDTFKSQPTSDEDSSIHEYQCLTCETKFINLSLF